MESGLHAPGPPGGLRGRSSECALLDDLVSAIRRGESRSLVLRGEAGIGKTALLEFLTPSASDMTVVRAAEWTIGRENVVLDQAEGSIAYRFDARDAHLVLSAGTHEPI